MRHRHHKKLIRKEARELERRNARAARWWGACVEAMDLIARSLGKEPRHRPSEEVFCHRNELMTLRVGNTL